MNRTKPCLALTMLLAGGAAWCGTVGLWKDGRSYIRDGMLATLHEAGWKSVILQGADMGDEAELAGLDVVFLPAGWNAYQFARFNARRSLVRYVAGGKGILAGAFRSGYVRTANRPLFPQVGATHNRVNGPYISAHGGSDLAKAIDRPFCPGGWDHLVVKLGPAGKVFAVSSEDPVGVYGEVYGGRYLIFGAFIGIDAKTEPMQGTGRRALLAMLDWLNAAPKLSDQQKTTHMAQAELDFLRRERLYDWTLNERGPDRNPGILPTIRNRLAIPLESRQFTLQYLGQYLSGKDLKLCKSAAGKLGEAVGTLNARFQKELTTTAARTQRMTREELRAENPSLDVASVQKRVEATPGKTEEEKKAIETLLKRCSSRRSPAGAAKQVAMYLHSARLGEMLMPKVRLKELVRAADRTISELRPLVKAAKEKRVERELKQDLSGVRILAKACSASDAATRREAVTELGRIGGRKAVAALIEALEDADEKVRIQAIIGLGWTQSKKAVPALIKVAGGDDLFMRRRAVQALGQIGDSKATEALMANVHHEDFYVSENAILALGWLKAKAAVPELLKIVTSFDREDARQRGLMLASIRALGHIGDPSAVPALEKLATEADDFPANRRGRKPITNFYSTAQSLGLQGQAQLAIEEIKIGGRAEAGIKQADFLATKDKFYGLTKRFNALAGRPWAGLLSATFREETAAFWPYLWSGGMTGIHAAWGAQDNDPEEHVKLVKAAGDLGLRWIEVMPTGWNTFGAKRCSRKYGPHGIGKPGVELVLLKYQDEPAFQGFWCEETYPDISIAGAELEAWLKGRYGSDFRKALGLAEDLDIAGTTWSSWEKDKITGRLKVVFLEACSERLLASWRESQEWLHGVRKGCAFTYSISAAQTLKFPGLTGKAGAVIDVNGPESYQCFGRFNSFLMELHKDGEARPAMSEFYNWYSPSPAHDVRGFAQHLMHGECFYAFAVHQVFEHGSTYDLWSWDASRWSNLKKIFLKARKTREYLAVPASAANVALLCSDFSCLAFDPINRYGASLPWRWSEHQAALWTALNQSQIPTDIIWAETVTPEKLKRYRVLVLSDSKIISDEHADRLRKWVSDGGTLIASGTTSLFDQWAEPRENYSLADLFGVDYGEHVGVADPEKIDTYCWKSGGATTFKAVSGLDPENFRNHVHRQLKPVKSLGTYAVSDQTPPHLPGIAPGTVCEYDRPLGYDRVKPTSAEVLAKFPNGDPALTVNRSGKGLCYFWSLAYPGLCHVASEWEMQANRLDFWPNVRELLTAMVHGGLAHGSSSLPVEVRQVPKEVEVTLRQQPEHDRWIVHLLDYDTRSNLVSAPQLTVHPPAGRAVKRMFYPDTDAELKFEASDDGVTARMRDFGVHDMLVIEWTP